MSKIQVMSGVATVAAFGVLLASNGTQAGRNASAQAEAAHSYPVPAFSQRINERIAVAAAKPEAMVAPTPTAAPKVQAIGFTLKPVAIELPGSDREFPPGPGAELVANNCVSCHSSGMILNQPSLTKATWTAEVSKMLLTYKAPVAQEDVEPIVAYLASMPVAK